MTQLPQAFSGKKVRDAVRNFFLDHHVPCLLRRGGAASAAQVAMLHMGRCGSTVLGEMLGSQGDIFWAGEIFEDMHNRYPGITGGSAGVTRILRRSMTEPSSLRSLVRRTAYPATYGTYGFETKYLREQHLRPEEIDMSLTAYLALLKAYGFDRFIVLHRHNYLRMIVSRAAGLTSGAWHTERTIDGPAPG